MTIQTLQTALDNGKTLQVHFTSGKRALLSNNILISEKVNLPAFLVAAINDGIVITSINIMHDANSLDINAIAEACHNANNNYCVSIGQPSYGAWSDMVQTNKDLQIKAVINLLKNPDLTGEDLFNVWKAGKIKDGWIYGPVKDAATKQHPCIVDYAYLPEIEKMKDTVIINTVKAFN